MLIGKHKSHLDRLFQRFYVVSLNRGGRHVALAIYQPRKRVPSSEINVARRWQWQENHTCLCCFSNVYMHGVCYFQCSKLPVKGPYGSGGARNSSICASCRFISSFNRDTTLFKSIIQRTGIVVRHRLLDRFVPSRTGNFYFLW